METATFTDTGPPLPQKDDAPGGETGGDVKSVLRTGRLTAPYRGRPIMSTVCLTPLPTGRRRVNGFRQFRRHAKTAFPPNPRLLRNRNTHHRVPLPTTPTAIGVSNNYEFKFRPGIREHLR